MDLIDRKALLERMRENASFAASYKPYMTKEEIAFRVLKDAKEQALRFVEDASTIEAVPVVHGKWIETDYVKYDGHGECVRYPKQGLKCSNCLHGYNKHYLWCNNFCPNCGADMRKAYVVEEAIEIVKGEV